uniref:SPARC related modular calcium binding 1 n=1 Tax=Ciona savignyi TaxID=51511 RepID=H2ZQK1_CIOSA
ECEFACGGSRKRKYCGSDGTTFRNSCQVKKAKCYDPLLKVKRGKCKAKDVCSQARTHAILSPYARYLPLCTSDGRYAPHQCYDTPPYCVCLDPEGKMIPGSAHRHDQSDCPPIEGKFSDNSRTRLSAVDDTAARPVETQDKYSKQTLHTAIEGHWSRVIWLALDGSKKSRPSARTCISEREKSLLLQSSGTNVYVPQCEGGNLFNPVQCHASAGYCWCVTTDTGHPIIGTTAGSIRHFNFFITIRLNLSLSSAGCKKTFVPSALETISTRLRGSPGSGENYVTATSWFFELLDKNHDGMLNKRESRGMKKKLKGKIGPMRCVRRLVKSCDANKNKKIDETEFFACLGVSR